MLPCHLLLGHPCGDTSALEGPYSCAGNASPYLHTYCGQGGGNQLDDLESKPSSLTRDAIGFKLVKFPECI